MADTKNKPWNITPANINTLQNASAILKLLPARWAEDQRYANRVSDLERVIAEYDNFVQAVVEYKAVEGL